MRISDEVMEVLECGRSEGNQFYLPEGQLERPLYMAVDKVLKLLGGKWNTKAKCHLFTEDVGDLVDTVVLIGEITDIKKELQYFATPRAVVDILIAAAEVGPEDLVLEPSAGEGAIALALQEVLNPKLQNLDFCEIHRPFAVALTKKNMNWMEQDFLKYETKLLYDKVIANPPFTRQQDIDHVRHMIDVCEGRVVSVMSAGVLFRQNKKTVEFRNMIANLGGEFHELPEGSFKESGTMVNACYVVVDTI